MNSFPLRTFGQRATRLAAIAIVFGSAILPSISSAAPVTYSFSSQAGTAFSQGTSDSNAFLASLGASPVITGTFVYDTASPQTGTTGAGLSIYGLAANVTLSLSNLQGSVGGHSFSDASGFVLVGNNKPFSNLASTDSVQLQADSSLVSSTHNFAGFSSGGYTAVNLRMFWPASTAGGPVEFTSSQALPPSLAALGPARIAIDINVSSNSTLISTNSVFFDNVAVAAVPEPELAALWLAGLSLLAGVARRKRNRASRG